MTMKQLRVWLTRSDTGPYSVPARVSFGGWTHTGYLSFQGDRIYVRDSRRKGHGQYQTIFDQHLENGQLEIRVGGRYQPAADVVANHNAKDL